MKSEWKVTSNPVGDKKIFIVFRIRDTAAVDHSGNRESAPGWHDNREDAQQRADELNKEENNV